MSQHFRQCLWTHVQYLRLSSYHLDLDIIYVIHKKGYSELFWELLCVLFKKYLSKYWLYMQHISATNDVHNKWLTIPHLFIYYNFSSLTFCYTTVIPLLIIFLTCTFVWPFNVIAMLGAGTEYHTLIDICERNKCSLWIYSLILSVI